MNSLESYLEHWSIIPKRNFLKFLGIPKKSNLINLKENKLLFTTYNLNKSHIPTYFFYLYENLVKYTYTKNLNCINVNAQRAYDLI